MMIDAHHHLWKYKPKEYGWMDHTMALLQQDYCPENLEPELQGSGLIGTVVVQARQSLEETSWLLELADEYPFIKGVVGWVDLCSRELEKQLKELAVHPKLVGVRHVIQDELDDDFMLRDDFRQGISALQTFNLVYDLLLFPRHLDCAVKLVKEFPKQRFVLDHLAKPLIKSRKMEPWKSDITSLASFPNVWCKLSGMVTEADLDNWQYEDFVPYMEVVLEAFGHERIMLGSDWPVCRLAAEYSEVIEIVTEFIKPLKKSEREKILYQNAIDCYQLKIQD